MMVFNIKKDILCVVYEQAIKHHARAMGVRLWDLSAAKYYLN
jgi:hypothetical protein